MSLGEYSKTDARTNETSRLLAGDGNGEDEEYSDEDSIFSQDILRMSSRDEGESEETKLLSVFTITCILSSAFAYGCIMTTLFLITLPIECERIEKQFPDIPKSVSLVVKTIVSRLQIYEHMILIVSLLTLSTLKLI